MTGLSTLVADHSARSADTLGRASDEAVSEREINYNILVVRSLVIALHRSVAQAFFKAEVRL